jgi:transketolase
MRGVFFDRFRERFEADESLFFLTGDTGYNLVEGLFAAAPRRALNVGVAEQNLIGIAAGLCNAGYVPVCYAITNFLVHRCLEQIRNDVCLHDYHVILVGTSTGYDNGALGATHHMVDDIGCVKPLPNMRIYSPSGRQSMATIISEALEEPHPAFIRISKADYVEPVEVTSPNHLAYAGSNDVLLLSHGRMVQRCVESVADLGCSVYAMDRIKPLDGGVLEGLFRDYRKVFVVEDNFSSGLYNSVCEWVVSCGGDPVSLASICPAGGYDELAGSTDHLDNIHGLTIEAIRDRLKEAGR